ncbi:MAG: hypothetical protein K2X27_07170 [Candidatus Obscuribacterales bacterium]|nr:hypothetical protein [Candidatus Obscuribacterales bacterium]
MSRARNSSGSGLIEGTAGVVVITLVFLAAVCFILGAGLSSYYKYRVANVVDRCAEYMSRQVVWAGMNNPDYAGKNLLPRSKTLVNKLLADSGLPQASLVEVVDSGTELTLHVKVDGLPLLPGSKSLPMTISMQDTAVAPIPDSKAPAIMSFTCGGMALYAPAYGLFVNPYSSGSNLPAPRGVASFYNLPPHFQACLTMPAGSTYSQTIQ